VFLDQILTSSSNDCGWNEVLKVYSSKLMVGCASKVMMYAVGRIGCGMKGCELMGGYDEC
jgi:hypothetical protein